VNFRAVFPSTGHHRDGIKQSTVTGQITWQVLSLPVMAVWQVTILFCFHHQGIDGDVWFAETRGGHCR
jgi:hypothetical protein